jgi:hypothetical protein
MRNRGNTAMNCRSSPDAATAEIEPLDLDALVRGQAVFLRLNETSLTSCRSFWNVGSRRLERGHRQAAGPS